MLTTMRNNKILFYIYQVYKIFIVLPMFGLSTIVFVILGMVLVLVTNDKTASLVGVAWAKFNGFITPMFVDIIGINKINKNQSYVIVANHQSAYDIYVIYGSMPFDFKWVMKAELRKAPFIGYFCNKIGHIFIDRSNPESAKASINSGVKMLRKGSSIMFFPEGTWSKTGKLLDFKKGAFKIAIDAGLPVLPVTIVNTRNILPSDSLSLFPGSAKLVFHDPINIEDYNDDNINELINRAKNSIQKGLDEPGSG
jgi:1-acyl-sn-glycerol-3-phosphate acyltransferase